MFTTSRVITSVAQDWIPNDKVDLLNHMCILILTRGNGTPLMPPPYRRRMSLRFVSLGHAHPEGVLRYLTTELVITFHSTDEMLVTAYGVIKVMTLHKEAIKVMTSPPSAAHVRAYMVVIDGEPLGTQQPNSAREEVPQLCPSDPQVGGPHVNCKWTLGTLQMTSCSSLWRISARRLLSGSWMHPQGPYTDPLGTSSGKWGSWDEWPGGHLSKRGRVGTHRTTTPTPSSHPTRWRVGTQRTISSTHSPHSTQWRYGTSYKHSGHGIVTWYPSYKHFQWQSHARQDGSVLWAMIPWGTVHKRPLSGVSGQRKYHAFSQRGSSGYGQVHGPYHQPGPYPPKIHSYFWCCSVIWHTGAKLLQSHPEQPQQSSFIYHEARRDPQSNQTA